MELALIRACKATTKVTATATAKSTVKIGKTTTLDVHAFLHILLPSLHDHKVKLLNFTFFGGLEHKAATSSFFSWTSKKCLIIELQKKIADIWRIERDGISAIKFEAARLITFQVTSVWRFRSSSPSVSLLFKLPSTGQHPASYSDKCKASGNREIRSL